MQDRLESTRKSSAKQRCDTRSTSGRRAAQVAHALELSHETLENWVARAKKGHPLQKRPPAQPVDDAQAGLVRQHQENARLK